MAKLEGFIVATQYSWQNEPTYIFSTTKMETQGYVTIQAVAIEHELLPQDAFIRGRIAALQEQQKAVKAAANAEVAELADEIQKLSALAYTPATERREVDNSDISDVDFTPVSKENDGLPF